VVVLIAGSTSSALRAVRPPNLHITHEAASRTVIQPVQNYGRRSNSGSLAKFVGMRRPGQALPRVLSVDDVSNQWTPRVRGTVFDPRLSNDSEQRPEANMVNWSPRQSSDTLY
jgi:hypothetical protein